MESVASGNLPPPALPCSHSLIDHRVAVIPGEPAHELGARLSDRKESRQVRHQGPGCRNSKAGEGGKEREGLLKKRVVAVLEAATNSGARVYLSKRTR